MIPSVAAFYRRLLAIIEEKPDTDTVTLAAMVVDEITPAAQRDVLIHLVVPEIDLHRRVRAREIEEEARRLATAGSAPSSSKGQQDNHPDAKRFAQLYDDPTRDVSGMWLTSSQRRSFRGWVSRRDGKGGFDAWLSHALDLVDNEDFRASWIPGYARAARLDTITKKLANYADTLRFEVTAELLDTVFATGDGARVSWRDATVAQHEERIDMLAKMIGGTSETAAMHIRAVQMIKDAGVESLAQLTEQKPMDGDA